MRNSETHKKYVSIFGLGAHYDLNPEMTMLLKQGFYRDSRNMRLSNTNENDYALERIKGEQVLYNGSSTDYTCIGVVEVNYHVVEIWCRDNDSDVVFRIDGQIMLHDSDNLMGLSVLAPLQIHKNDSCNGGEFYFVDNINPPYIYSVKDIIDNFNAHSLKYFGDSIYGGDFNPLLYQTTLTLPINTPVFVELISTGAGGGLPVGQYSYSIRYVDNDGNRTLFSPPTPLIPVVQNFSTESIHYKGSKTYGGESDVASPTGYGVRIRFRVDNKVNYNYIEVGRTAWNTVQGLGYVPVKQYYKITRELLNGEFSTWDFDDIDGLAWLDVTDNETTEQMGAIVTAKAIRYFNGYLTLGNVTYASRDLDGDIVFKEDAGALWHPFIDNIGGIGYSDPWNSAYRRQYMSGERFGFGVACYDDQGNVALVVPIESGVLNMNNVQMPNRRNRCSNRTVSMCQTNWKGLPRMTDTDNIDAQYVHERYYFNAAKQKTGNGVKSLKNGEYSILHPTAFDDGYSDHDYHINTYASSEYDLDNSILNNSVSHAYNPTTFSPDIYANGLAVAGIESLPSWVSAFSIVRTKPAERVVAQGLSMYSMTDTPVSGSSLSDTYDVVNKELDSVWFYSDDVNNGYASISANSEAQFVSPVGFFSEVYMNKFSTLLFDPFAIFCNNADVICYANQYYTNPTNPTSPELYRDGTTNPYYTQFGRWRNDPASPAFAAGGDTLFGILAVSPSSSIMSGRFSDRNDYYRLRLNDNIYTQTTPQSLPLYANMEVNHASNQDWHEPWYVTNIVNDGRNIVDNNINEYILTGHIQKIRSKIGVGTGIAKTIPLIDERWQDCIVNYYSATKSSDNVFVWIVDITTREERAWIDITYKSVADVNNILSDISTFGFYSASDGVGGVVKCYGVYYSNFDTVNTRSFSIEFVSIPNVSSRYCIPAVGVDIVVKYDNRFPLIVFGGDSVVGNSVFAPIDGESNDKGQVVDGKALYAFTGLPYPAYTFNSNYKIVADPTTISGVNFQDQETVPIGIIRQMVVSFISESRSHIPYYYCEKSTGTNACEESEYNGDNAFPRVHYVMRPLKWSDSCENNFDGGNEMDPLYKTDYPGEFIMWGKGGFRVNPVNNQDYSQWNSFNTTFSKPKVGFKEKTRFCSRIAWSLKRNINEQDDPNLKTFLALNVFDISDSTQEIKFLYDNNSEKGNNLIALTGSGTCLLVTDKKIISEVTGNDLAYIDANKLIMGEYWLSRSIGCSGEFWRGCAEYDNNLFFPNSESIYRITGIQIQDIGRNNSGSYFSKLHPVLEGVRSGYTDSVCAVYNVRDNEYWLNIKRDDDVRLSINRILNLRDNTIYGNTATTLYTVQSGEHLVISASYTNLNIILPNADRINTGDYFYVTSDKPVLLTFSYGAPPFSILSVGYTYMLQYMPNGSKNPWVIEQVDHIPSIGATYVFNNSPQKQVWTGYFDYNGDKMLNVYGDSTKNLGVLLMRDYDTYRTNIGDTINGANVNGSVNYYFAPESFVTKELIDQTFNCNQSPTYANYSTLNSNNIEANQTLFKNYTYGYYTQVPRKLTPNRFRIQGKYVWCEVGCDTAGDWILASVENGYKAIR